MGLETPPSQVPQIQKKGLSRSSKPISDSPLAWQNSHNGDNKPFLTLHIITDQCLQMPAAPALPQQIPSDTDANPN